MKFAGLIGILVLAACTPYKGLQLSTSLSSNSESFALVPLEGTASDDGLPAPLSTHWDIVSGPGQVEIEDATKLKTTARFRDPGQYIIRLTAYDGATSRYDEITINVQ